MDFMEKNREICKDIRKGVNFFLCLNSSLEKFLTNFLAEASLEQSLPENAVANYDVFLVRIADNPFVLFTTHTLVKQSLLTHKSIAAEVREENHVVTRSMAHLGEVPHFSKSRLPWQIRCLVLCESENAHHVGVWAAPSIQIQGC